MNIEKLARNAIKRIKETYGLPNSGLLAGGSIANLIWEEVSGNKAIVNDIDIFILNEIRDSKNHKEQSYFSYNSGGIERVEFDNYQGLRFINKGSEFYSIISSNTDDMINTIIYDSNTNDRNIIIESFDFNCVMIGYIIEEDKVIWAQEFEDFLINKRIKIINGSTPQHSAIRYAKKCIDLNIEVDDKELEILEYIISSSANDVFKHQFMKKYHDMFITYQRILYMFNIEQKNTIIPVEIEISFPNTDNIDKDDNKLWSLISKEDKNIRDLGFIGDVVNSLDIIKYFRRAEDNNEMSNFKNYAWLKIGVMIDSEEYLEDCNISDVDYLCNFYKFFQPTVLLLRGFKLRQQVDLIKKLLLLFKDDKSIAIALLDQKKVDCNTILLDDEMSCLLLELSVRKFIIDSDMISRVKYNFFCIENMNQEAEKSTLTDRLLGATELFLIEDTQLKSSNYVGRITYV